MITTKGTTPSKSQVAAHNHGYCFAMASTTSLHITALMDTACWFYGQTKLQTAFINGFEQGLNMINGGMMKAACTLKLNPSIGVNL